jgi:hypothetical protein
METVRREVGGRREVVVREGADGKEGVGAGGRRERRRMGKMR